MAASSPPSSQPSSSPLPGTSSGTSSAWSSSRRVLIAVTQPHAALITSQRRAVEPLIHAPETIEPARERGIRVIDDAVAQRERAHPRTLAQKRRHVGAGGGGNLTDRRLAAQLFPFL